MGIRENTHTRETVEANWQPGRWAEINVVSAISDNNKIIGELSIRIHAIEQGDVTACFSLTDPAIARRLSVILAEHAKRLDNLSEEANFLRHQKDIETLKDFVEAV